MMRRESVSTLKLANKFEIFDSIFNIKKHFQNGLSGRELFTFNPDLIGDDDEEANDVERERDAENQVSHFLFLKKKRKIIAYINKIITFIRFLLMILFFFEIKLFNTYLGRRNKGV